VDGDTPNQLRKTAFRTLIRRISDEQPSQKRGRRRRTMQHSEAIACEEDALLGF
jgi:hypothetical protein